MNIPIGTQEDWKKLIVDGFCECEEEHLVKLVDDMADKFELGFFFKCTVCNKERLGCKYCGEVPCKCIEINNKVDELRGN